MKPLTILFALGFAAVFTLSYVADGRAGVKVFQGELGAGVASHMPQYIDSGKVKPQDVYIPYGSLHLRLNIWKKFSPEIIIKDSGSFSFKQSGIKRSDDTNSYNSYYLKIPLGIPVPFFHYDSGIAVDGKFSSMRTGMRLNGDTIVNNELYKSGERLTAVSSEMIFRLYLNTPIVLSPSINEYSYFGFFYSEHTLPRTATSGNADPDPKTLFVSTAAKTGGIFYDMQKDTPLKGLNFGIAVNIGYGDIYVLDSVSSINASFGNVTQLLSVNASASLGYRYVFNNNLGVSARIGVDYFVTTEFLNTADKNMYSVNTGGELKYYAGLNFIFGY